MGVVERDLYIDLPPKDLRCEAGRHRAHVWQVEPEHVWNARCFKDFSERLEPHDF